MSHRSVAARSPAICLKTTIIGSQGAVIVTSSNAVFGPSAHGVRHGESMAKWILLGRLPAKGTPHWGERWVQLRRRAARTRAGVKGYSRKRTPVASNNALAMAAVAGPNTSSPAPLEG